LFDGGIFAITSAPVTEPLPAIVKRLNAAEPELVFGYASVLHRLAAEREAGRLRIAPYAISSTSEQLDAAMRARIESAFGIPIVDSFATSEGLAGSSLPGEELVSLASDVAIVELVDEHGRPVPPGVPSAKALVTNLFNR
jgi:phenylacetate-coenzyme A ligase PaaK-like adenylate-forming protein